MLAPKIAASITRVALPVPLVAPIFPVPRADARVPNRLTRLAMSCSPDVLKQVPLFALLDDEELAVLATQVDIKTYAARQRVYKVGDPGGRAYVMISGSVRVTAVDEDQQEVVIHEPAVG